MESRVLPSADVAPLLSRFVCVKVDADNPGEAEKILSQVKGNILPFYAYLTPDGKFISGTSGYRDVGVFKADLEGVMKSELLKVPAELEKKLAKLADQAEKDLEAKKTSAVLKAAKDAQLIRGFSASKDRLLGLQGKALESGRERIREAADLCRDGKYEEAGTLVASLLKDFKGTELEAAGNAANKGKDKLKTASIEVERGNKAAAKRQLELVVKECKDAAPFVELAEARLKELAP
jgi:hypothetical protein